MLADTDKILLALAPRFLTSRAGFFSFSVCFLERGENGWELARPRDRGATGAGHVDLGVSLTVGPGEVRGGAGSRLRVGAGRLGWLDFRL